MLNTGQRLVIVTFILCHKNRSNSKLIHDFRQQTILLQLSKVRNTVLKKQLIYCSFDPIILIKTYINQQFQHQSNVWNYIFYVYTPLELQSMDKNHHCWIYTQDAHLQTMLFVTIFTTTNLMVNYTSHRYYLVLPKNGGITPKISNIFHVDLLLPGNIYINTLKPILIVIW